MAIYNNRRGSKEVKHMAEIDIRKLKSLRTNKRLTQFEVAKALGYETALGYHHIESGKTALRADQAYMLSKIFEIEIKDLFFTKNVSVVETL